MLILYGAAALLSVMFPVRTLPEPDGRCCQRTVALPNGGTKIVCDMPGLGCVCDPRQNGD
jgi:hypothetical protein